MDVLVKHATIGITLFVVAVSSCAQDQDMPMLVDADWVSDHISDDNVVLLDVRDTAAYQAGHIKDAVFSDYTQWRVTKHGVADMLPSKQSVQRLIRDAGISSNSHVVVVSGVNKVFDFGRAARVYWTLQLAGLTQISVLDGGLEAWKHKGWSLSTDVPRVSPSQYTVTQFDSSLLATQDDVKSAVVDDSIQLIDARSKEYFEGHKKHSQACSSGTIKSAVNLSQANFISSDGTLISKSQSQKLVDDALTKNHDSAILFCNTGHSASTDWFVLSEILGYNVKLYDGSMVEWTQNKKNELDNKK